MIGVLLRLPARFADSELLFFRPSLQAQHSAVLPVLQEIEGLVLEVRRATVTAAGSTIAGQGASDDG